MSYINISSLIDRRRKGVKKAMEQAYGQMHSYFMARYSFGQQPDEMRLTDWEFLIGALVTLSTVTKEDSNYPYGDWDRHYRLDEKFLWPSGNEGSIRSLIGCYHDGWDLVFDILPTVGWDIDCEYMEQREVA